MIDEFDLSPIQLDALREIGNVGAGNSATALSQIINKRIDMNVPNVALVPIEDVPELVGGPDTVVVGVFLRVYGKAPGNILFLLPQKSAFYLVDTLMGREHGTTTKLDPMDVSALKEIGNILSGAYLNAFLTSRTFQCCRRYRHLQWTWRAQFSTSFWFSSASWATTQWLSKQNSWPKMTASTGISSSCPTPARWVR